MNKKFIFNTKILILKICWWFLIGVAEGAVLDPALYLSPSPPLTPPKPEIPDLWPRRERHAELALAVIPIGQLREVNEDNLSEHIETTTTKKPTCLLESTTPPTSTTTQPSTTTEVKELMDKAETIWPGPIFGTIHVPLTFGLTGTYGRYGTGSGLIASSYGSVTDMDTNPGFLQLYGKSGLAGSSYGSYSGYGTGTRIYGSAGGANWSGWGNGKWGHYGKG